VKASRSRARRLVPTRDNRLAVSVQERTSETSAVDALPKAPAVRLVGVRKSYGDVVAVISIDDFVVTYFNSGSSVTFALFVWGAARIGAPPQVNVIGTALFVIALGLMLLNVVLQRVRASKGVV
jgi:hypothetical protein